MKPSNPENQISLVDLQTGVIALHLMPVTSSTTDDWTLLDAGERARASRLRRPSDQVLFIQAHGLLRRVLSRYAPEAPEAWRFVVGPHGKPALCSRTHPAWQTLRFNLSHCTGHVAVAVACDREVGVDIERLDALPLSEDLAETLLAPRELRDWRGLGGDAQAQQRFLMARWTFKEAVLKALGCGLGQIEPNQLEVMPGPVGPGWQARSCAPPPADDMRVDWPARGWLQGGLAGAGHHWALACLRHHPDEHLTWRRSDPALAQAQTGIG